MKRIDGGLRVTAPVLIGLTISACGGAGGSGDWRGTVSDSAGVTVIANPSDGLWTDADRWTVAEELRIGTTGGDPNYQFAQISGIAELPDGRLMIMDMQAQHLRVFSADGTYLNTIGGPGAGPGEFAIGAGPVLVSVGDTIVVPDVTNQRVNRFGPDGEPLGSYPLDFSAGIPMAWQDRGDGSVAVQFRALNLPNSGTTDPKDVIVMNGPAGSAPDTLMVLESGGTIDLSGGVPQLTFFSPEPTWSLIEGGLVFGVNDDYRFQLYGSGGELRQIITKPFEPTEVTEADKDLLLDAIIALYEQFGIAGPQLDAVRQATGFADLYPAYALLRAGPSGSIWVQHLRKPSDLTPEEREGFDPQLGFGGRNWDVFDSAGRFMGLVEMPARFQPLRFDDNRILGVWRDELDVQYAMVLRIDGV